MDLNSMFQNLGPAGGSLLTGMQMADAEREQRSMEAMRKAQMDEIMQRTAQTALMNPLEVEAKQQSIAANKLKAVQEQNAYRDEILTKAIPEIEREAPLRRHARLEEIFTRAGLPLDPTDRQAFYNIHQDDLPKTLKERHEANVRNTPDFIKAMAQEGARKESHIEGIKEQGKNAIEVAKIGAASREAIANAKKKATDIVSQVQAGKLSYEKAAVAFSVMSEMSDDPTDKAKYLQLAQTYEQMNLNAKNAASQGKIDPGAATGLPTIQTPPVLGGGGAKRGTAENPIDLD
jgi:hypothetical protein